MHDIAIVMASIFGLLAFGFLLVGIIELGIPQQPDKPTRRASTFGIFAVFADLIFLGGIIVSALIIISNWQRMQTARRHVLLVWERLLYF